MLDQIRKRIYAFIMDWRVIGPKFAKPQKEIFCLYSDSLKDKKGKGIKTNFINNSSKSNFVDNANVVQYTHLDMANFFDGLDQ